MNLQKIMIAFTMDLKLINFMYMCDMVGHELADANEALAKILY